MTYLSSGIIKSSFKILNEAKIPYLLIRNINNELPSNLIPGKDIDILIQGDNLVKMISHLKLNGFKERPHPWRGDIFLYALPKFKFLVRDGLIFDFCTKLPCRSINQGEWLPLDDFIQRNAWETRVLKSFDGVEYYTLSNEVELVTLIVRSIFDKNKFESGYKCRIKGLLKINLDEKLILEMLSVVFFLASDFIWDAINSRSDFSKIYRDYISFKNY